jgi:hypothetical protein
MVKNNGDSDYLVEYNVGLVSSNSVLLHCFFVLRSNILWYNNPKTSEERKYYEYGRSNISVYYVRFYYFWDIFRFLSLCSFTRYKTPEQV